MRRALLMLVFAGVAALAVASGNPTLLTVLPVLALFALLCSGTYVGESRVVARLRRRPPPRRLRAPAVRVARCDVLRPRGGRLVACGLARRGPPSVVVAA